MAAEPDPDEQMDVFVVTVDGGAISLVGSGSRKRWLPIVREWNQKPGELFVYIIRSRVGPSRSEPAPGASNGTASVPD